MIIWIYLLTCLCIDKYFLKDIKREFVVFEEHIDILNDGFKNYKDQPGEWWPSSPLMLSKNFREKFTKDEVAQMNKRLEVFKKMIKIMETLNIDSVDTEFIYKKCVFYRGTCCVKNAELLSLADEYDFAELLIKYVK